MKVFLACLGLVGLLSGCRGATGPIAAPGSASVARAPGERSESRWLAATATTASSAGAGELRVLGQGSGVAGDALSALVDVAEGRCVLLFARGSESLEDLDLLVFSEDGSELGSDESSDPRPTVLYCSERAERIYVSARVVQGRGLLELGAQDVPQAQRTTVARAIGTDEFSKRQLEPESWPGLDAALTAHRERIGGRWIDLRRVAIPIDARVPSLLGAEVPANRCLDVLVLPSDDVARLDLDILDDQGRIFARGEARGSERWTVVCAGSQTTTLSFEVRPMAGRGLALFLLSSSRDEKQNLGLRTGAIPPRLPLAAWTTASESDRKNQGTAEAIQLEVGSIASSNIALSGCGWLHFTPQDPLLGYEAQVWSPSGQLLAETEAIAATRLFVCLPESKARVDLLAGRRAGTLVFSRQPAPAPQPALLRFPLAAAHLMSEWATGSGDQPLAVPAVQMVSLTRERIERIPLTIPAGQCIEVWVGIDAGGWGPELRLVDAATTDILDFARGSSSASARACAAVRVPRPVVLEMRVGQGQTAGLWANRFRNLMPSQDPDPLRPPPRP